jgi:hypothetical protein
MNTELDHRFTGRERTRLRRARENGFLNAGCRSPQELRDAHGFWCWRLRLPVVWFERLTPRSKYGRICVDLFTTSSVLNEKGVAELSGLADGALVSSHDVRWDRVPRARLEEVARRALRAALRTGNYELAERVRVPAKNAGTPKVLPWKISA